MPKTPKISWRVRSVKYPTYAEAVAAAVDIAIATEETVAVEHLVGRKVVEMVDIEAKMSLDME